MDFKSLLIPLFPQPIVKCSFHKQEQVLQMCTDLDCFNCYLCNKCMQDNNLNKEHIFHPEQLKTLEISIKVLSEYIQNNVQYLQRVHQESISKDKDFYNWIEDSESHFQKTAEFIKNQKKSITEDFDAVIIKFSQIIMEEKEKYCSQFDEFFKNYKTSFLQFKNYYNEIFKLIIKFKYLSNPNNLSAKLSCQSQNDNEILINELKKSLKNSQQVVNKQNYFIEQINNSMQELSKFMDNIPHYIQIDQKSLIKQLETLFKDEFQKNIQITQTEKVNFQISSQQQQFQSKKQIFNINESQLTQQQQQLQFQPLQLKQIENQNSQILLQKQLQNNYTASNQNQNQQALQQQQLLDKTFQQINQINAPYPQSQIINSFQSIQQPLINNANKPIVTQQQIVTFNQQKTIPNQSQFVFKNIENNNKLMFTSEYTQNIKMQFINKLTINFQIKCFSVLRNGLIAIGCQDGKLYLIDKTLQNQIDVKENYKGHYKEVVSLCNLEENIIASSSLDNMVIIWSYSDEDLIIKGKFAGLGSYVNKMLDMLDGQHILIGNKQGEISLWNYHNQVQLQCIKNHQDIIQDLIFLKKNELCAAISKNNQLSIYKIIQNQDNICLENENIIENNFKSPTCIVSLNSFQATNSICIFGFEGNLVLYNYQQNIIQSTILGHYAPITENLVLSGIKQLSGCTLISLSQFDKKVCFFHISMKLVADQSNQQQQQIIQINKEEQQILPEYISNYEGQHVAQFNNEGQIYILNETNKEIMIFEIIYS